MDSAVNAPNARSDAGSYSQVVSAGSASGSSVYEPASDVKTGTPLLVTSAPGEEHLDTVEPLASAQTVGSADNVPLGSVASSAPAAASGTGGAHDPASRLLAEHKAQRAQLEAQQERERAALTGADSAGTSDDVQLAAAAAKSLSVSDSSAGAAATADASTGATSGAVPGGAGVRATRSPPLLDNPPAGYPRPLQRSPGDRSPQKSGGFGRGGSPRHGHGMGQLSPMGGGYPGGVAMGLPVVSVPAAALNEGGRRDDVTGIVTSLRLFVGKLPASATAETLRNYFTSVLRSCGHGAPEGGVVDVYLPLDASHRPRGFSFVSFADRPTLEMVVSFPREHVIEGRPVIIDVAAPRGLKVDQAGHVDRSTGTSTTSVLAPVLPVIPPGAMAMGGGYGGPGPAGYARGGAYGGGWGRGSMEYMPFPGAGAYQPAGPYGGAPTSPYGGGRRFNGFHGGYRGGAPAYAEQAYGQYGQLYGQGFGAAAASGGPDEAVAAGGESGATDAGAGVSTRLASRTRAPPTLDTAGQRAVAVAASHIPANAAAANGRPDVTNPAVPQHGPAGSGEPSPSTRAFTSLPTPVADVLRNVLPTPGAHGSPYYGGGGGGGARGSGRFQHGGSTVSPHLLPAAAPYAYPASHHGGEYGMMLPPHAVGPVGQVSSVYGMPPTPTIAYSPSTHGHGGPFGYNQAAAAAVYQQHAAVAGGAMLSPEYLGRHGSSFAYLGVAGVAGSEQ